MNTNSSLVAFELENTFIQLILIQNINFNIKNIANNTQELMLTNLGYLLNNVTNNVSTERIEKLYTLIKENLSDSTPLLKISDVYISEFNDSTLVIVPFKESYKIFQVENVYTKNQDMILKDINLSESFDIFSDPSKMPALYNEEKKGFFKRIINMFTIGFFG